MFDKLKHSILDLFSSKKIRYLVFAGVFSGLSFYYSEAPINNDSYLFEIVFCVFVIIASIATQFPNIKTRNIIPIIFLPLHLALGTMLSLSYFPNLGLPIRVIFVLGVGLVAYMALLTTNIFLVIGDREDTIPLYRVALTWSQVLIVLVSIPYFAGIYKLPFISLTQNLITAISAFFFVIYLLWVLGFDREVKKITLGEKGFMAVMIAYIIFMLGIATSFYPAESFLRSLFMSSILLSSLGYLNAHYKNIITKKLVFEYAFMSIIFLILLFVFPA